MPARFARLRTAVSSFSGSRRLTDLSLGRSSNRMSRPPERSYSVRSAVATKSSASLSVLNVGIGFFIIRDLLAMHVTGADGAQQLADRTATPSEHDECSTPVQGRSNGWKAPFVLEVLLVR